MAPGTPLDDTDSNKGSDFVLKRRQGLILMGIVLLMVGYFFWTVWSDRAHEWTPSEFFYPKLATAFLEGKTFLDTNPDPRLLALSNPYDPILNDPYRVHDASLYHGRYYLYFGPAPAVLLFAPFRLLTGHDFPQSYAPFLFCSSGYIFSVLLFLALVRDRFPQTPFWLLVMVVFSLGLANTCPFLLRRADVYETAISCAYCFLQLAFVFFYRAISTGQHIQVRLLLVGFCLGVAVASRYNYLFTLGIFSGYLIYFRYTGQAQSWRILLGLVPAGVTGALLAWYNFARFGNPLEFGQQFQLAAIEVSKIHFTSLVNIPADIRYYFFQPPQFTAEFPFVQLPKMPEAHFDPKDPTRFYGLEKVAGLFVISPVSLLALAVPFLFIGIKSVEEKGRTLRLTLGFIALATLTVLAPILCVCGATMRYMVDFAPEFIFLGCIMMCFFINRLLANFYFDQLRRILFFLILFLGCWNGLMLGFSGCYDWLKVFNPQIYTAISHFFAPVEWVLHGVQRLFSH